MRPDTEHGILFEGRWYLRDVRGYYYNSHTRKRLHQAVWISHNGPIPKGCEIHHKDLNKENNDISNLECLTRKEHHDLHNALLTDEERQWRRENLDKNARPKASEWHKSAEGREWHRNHVKEQIAKGQLNKKMMFNCSMCGKEFESIARNLNANHFCCNACKARYLRKKRREDKSATRMCVICGKIFSCSKWSNTETCSPTCACELKKQNKQRSNAIPITTKPLF